MDAPLLGQKAKATTGLSSLIRHLDEDGTFEPESTMLNNGMVQGIAGRSNLVSAEDLVEMLIDALIPQLKILIRQELACQRTLDK